MGGKRFKEEQSIAMLQDAEVEALSFAFGMVLRANVLPLEAKYLGLEVSEVMRLWRLEGEN